MEFEKNAKTHGKLMGKIFVNKKNVVCTFLLSLCDVIELDTFFNNFMPGICLNFVIEKNQFCHGKLMEKITQWSRNPADIFLVKCLKPSTFSGNS